MRRWTLIALLTAAFLASTSLSAVATHVWYNDAGNRKHWSDNDPSFPRGYVYWFDNTGAEWPVYSSAIKWDEEPLLDGVYVTGSCSSSHCVTISEVDFDNTGCAPPYGRVSGPTTTAGHFTTDTWMRVDRQCDNRNAADRRELVCHEMGHTIGLYERPETANTCMRVGNMIGETLPDDHDFGVVHTSHNHDH